MLLTDIRRYTIAVALLCAGAMATAQEQTEATAPVIESEALAALEKMGVFLNSLQTFAVHAETSIDEILVDNGQKIQLSSQVAYRVRRPNGLFAEVNSARKQRQYYYDGNTVTVYAPTLQYYAVFEAPGTIRETLNIAEADYDLQLPLRDLFVWGSAEADTATISSALYIGLDIVDGAICEQYAYRQDDIDWQLWLRQGEQPLPCKLVITTTSKQQQPQYSAVLRWELDAAIDAAGFAFTPPEGAYEIAITKTEVQ